MLKKFIPFFGLQIAGNVLWAFWVLPMMNEQGTLREIAEWLVVQISPLALFSILLFRQRRYAFWLLALYAGLILLFGLGTLGWALVGPGTPFSVYVVCLLFFISGFGVLFLAMKGLNIGQNSRRIRAEDE